VGLASSSTKGFLHFLLSNHEVSNLVKRQLNQWTQVWPRFDFPQKLNFFCWKWTEKCCESAARRANEENGTFWLISWA
jgi:hypothetical protein